ncbi:MAG TPA: PA14 domain-containing protein, partial [Verrucomicrobiae bacterium]|nr:PA14 domain-containing protein [Verrucomicrobiae bacterium]
MKPNRVLAVIAASLALASPGFAADQFIPGVLKHEFFSGKVRADVESGNVAFPTYTEFLTSFETLTGIADNYANRVSGVFIPPTTGNYVFFVCSDDDSDLFLSTDSNPANKRLIAQETAWSNNQQWVTSGGGSALTQKRSDGFKPGGAASAETPPFAGGIPLVKGTKYYIEGVHHEGGGGDDFTATYKLATDPDPVEGDLTLLTGDAIGVNLPAGGAITITNQPASVTVENGFSTTLSVGFSAPWTPTVQWRVNGVDIPGANGLSYNFVPTSSGDKYDAVVGISVDTYATNSVTTAAATVTTSNTPNGTVVGTGYLKNEYFPSIWNANILTNGALEGVSTRTVTGISSFHVPGNIADNYVQRVSGYFIPDTTGAYVFFISSDDQSALYLSTDANPANKRLIAQETAWSNDYQWTSSGGNSDLTLKRSDTWTDGTGTPYANGINLTAGTKYYIEADHVEGGGGDVLAVTAKLKAAADPADGSPSTLTGSKIAYLTTPASGLTITTQPQSITVFEGQPYTFSVQATVTSEAALVYQWRKGGTNIAGATGRTYSVGLADRADNGAKIDVVVSVPGLTNTVTSAQVTLTVNESLFVKGILARKVWSGAQYTLAGLEAGTIGDPTTSDYFTSLANTDFADSYVQQFSGFFVPAVTGDYVFFLSSDDQSDLFISTDDKPANKRLVAQESAWSNTKQWVSSAGSSALGQKRSDQWSPDAGVTVPYANGIHLVAGTRYYIEADHIEGGGGDNVAATFKLATDADPVDGDVTKFTGDRIGILAPAPT